MSNCYFVGRLKIFIARIAKRKGCVSSETGARLLAIADLTLIMENFAGDLSLDKRKVSRCSVYFAITQRECMLSNSPLRPRDLLSSSAKATSRLHVQTNSARGAT